MATECGLLALGREESRASHNKVKGLFREMNTPLDNSMCAISEGERPQDTGLSVFMAIYRILANEWEDSFNSLESGKRRKFPCIGPLATFGAFVVNL